MGLKHLWFRRARGALGSRGTGPGLVILCMGNLGLSCASVQINTAVGGVLVVAMVGNRESIEEYYEIEFFLSTHSEYLSHLTMCKNRSFKSLKGFEIF